MMGGIIESKLFFRIHFSQLNFEWEVNTTIKVLYSQSTFANLIWIEYFCIMKWKFYLLFGEDYLLWMCTYILRWNQSSNAKQICTHRSYLKYASKFERVRYGKNSNASWRLIMYSNKKGGKVYFGSYHPYKYEFLFQRLWKNTFFNEKIVSYL